MALSFGFLLPVGALTARYGRQLEKRWWFPAHKHVQMIALLAGLAGVGVAIAMVNKDYGGKHFENGHPKYGIVIAALVVLQATFAVLRPHKQPLKRRAWEWFHHALGWAIVIWAVVQVYSGLRLLSGTISDDYKVAYTVVVATLLAAAVLLQGAVWGRQFGARRRAKHRVTGGQLG
ncbi:unnamed protein product, partial [Phaeothamnion confervicola]